MTGSFSAIVLQALPTRRMARARLQLIDALAAEPAGTPSRSLYSAYVEASQRSDAISVFAHNAGRFPLTGTGIVNLYALFAETTFHITHASGRAGFIVPTGIATDDSTKELFAALANGRLVSLLDFRTGPGLFPDIGHQRYKFCLLTIGQAAEPVFTFFLTSPEQRYDERRRFTLTPADLQRLNPNTRTAPVFRSKEDAELTAKIYRNVPVLWDESRENGNPWKLILVRDYST